MEALGSFTGGCPCHERVRLYPEEYSFAERQAARECPIGGLRLPELIVDRLDKVHAEFREAALADAVVLHGQHFVTPCALLCVLVGGRRRPVPHISLAEATQEVGKRCYPMITPISVAGRGCLLAGL